MCRVLRATASRRDGASWSIVVCLRDERDGVPARDVRQYLLGMSLGVLLYQRDWLPMHVSALHTPTGVWAFTGHSGAGKSTLGAWLHYTQGWPMISDDVAVIKPEDSQAYLYPGPLASSYGRMRFRPWASTPRG